MPFKVSWYIPRVAWCYVWGTYTAEELKDSAAQGQELVRVGTPLVHDLIDMRHMIEYPKNLRDIIQLTPIFKEPNLGWVVVLTDDKMVRFLSHAVTSISKVRLRTFTDPQEALDFLARMDETLPPLPAYKEPAAKER
ncbi:MAG: hypothetical protein U0694_09170 [Anaerolineae bacterium]